MIKSRRCGARFSNVGHFAILCRALVPYTAPEYSTAPESRMPTSKLGKHVGNSAKDYMITWMKILVHLMAD